jgi:hypothetical protein
MRKLGFPIEIPTLPVAQKKIPCSTYTEEANSQNGQSPPTAGSSTYCRKKWTTVRASSSLTTNFRSCGALHRHAASRVPGSNAHLRRGAPAANSFRLCGVLQSSAHALGIKKRCALASSSPTIWRIVANPILAELHHQYVPDMIFGKERLLAPLLSKAWRLLASLLSASQSSFVGGNRQPPHGY